MSNFIMFDNFSAIFFALILLSLVLSIGINVGQLKNQGIKETFDVLALLVFATFGAAVMVSTINLVVMFLGIELMSLAVYALSASARNEKSSTEASLKYFVLGSFSAAFMLYGFALIYGVTGSLILKIPTNIYDPMLIVAFGLILIGFAFKISLVPFHFWTPDVYHGSPTSITGFMSALVKVAAFGAFLRIISTTQGYNSELWKIVFYVLAVLTMFAGNLLALKQESTKRMLAYSSIAHAGYIFMGLIVCAERPQAQTAIMFYLFSYVIMTIGAFGVVILVTAGTDEQYNNDRISSFNGLGWQYPLIGIAMTILMMSLAGIPPTIGFFAKFYLFSEVLSGGFTFLVIIAVINSFLSLYYYLRPVVALYFNDTPVGTKPLPAYKNLSTRAVIMATVVIALTAIIILQQCYFLFGPR